MGEASSTARFSCPRRGEVGPWRIEAVDYWRKNQWGTPLSRWWERQKNSDRPLGKLIERLGIRKYKRLGGTLWAWPWQPRTCSFCGSVHPRDAQRLFDEGWRLDRTSKRYKVYLEPPVGDRPYPFPGEGRPAFLPLFSPVPPVKLYTMHIEPGQYVGAKPKD